MWIMLLNFSANGLFTRIYALFSLPSVESSCRSLNRINSILRSWFLRSIASAKVQKPNPLMKSMNEVLGLLVMSRCDLFLLFIIFYVVFKCEKIYVQFRLSDKSNGGALFFGNGFISVVRFVVLLNSMCCNYFYIVSTQRRL